MVFVAWRARGKDASHAKRMGGGVGATLVVARNCAKTTTAGGDKPRPYVRRERMGGGVGATLVGTRNYPKTTTAGGDKPRPYVRGNGWVMA